MDIIERMEKEDTWLPLDLGGDLSTESSTESAETSLVSKASSVSRMLSPLLPSLLFRSNASRRRSLFHPSSSTLVTPVSPVTPVTLPLSSSSWINFFISDGDITTDGSLNTIV